MSIHVLRAHKWDKFTQSQYFRLNNELENVFVLYDDTYYPFPDNDSLPTIRLNSQKNQAKAKIILINLDDCQQINPLHKSNKEQIESQLIIIKILCPIVFDYIWIIEYDVYCDGNWKTTLSSCQNFKHDFLATNIYDYQDRILWNHWFGLYGKRRNKPPLHDRMSSFFPITRFSLDFISKLQQNLSLYSGFCEVFIPTFAKQFHLSYHNIPDSILHPVYFVFQHSVPPSITLSNNNKLLHPITTFDEISSI